MEVSGFFLYIYTGNKVNLLISILFLCPSKTYLSPKYTHNSKEIYMETSDKYIFNNEHDQI